MSRDKKAEAANEAAEAKQDAAEVKAAAAPKKKTAVARAPYTKDKDPDFDKMNEAQLREIFSEMEATAIDLHLTNGIAPPDGNLEEMRQQCKNVHNFIKVRTTEAKVLSEVKTKSKAKRQQGIVAAAEGDENMATKKAKKAPKKAKAKAKAKAPKKADGKWRGFDLTAKITKLKDHGLKDSAKADRWNKAAKCKTVAEFRATKLPTGTLKNMIKGKYLKVG